MLAQAKAAGVMVLLTIFAPMSLNVRPCLILFAKHTGDPLKNNGALWEGYCQ